MPIKRDVEWEVKAEGRIGRLRQKAGKFEASQVFTDRPFLKMKIKTKTNHSYPCSYSNTD